MRPNFAKQFGQAPASPAEPPRLVTGMMVADRYRVIGLLGQGGMAQVFEAEHIHVGRRVALKVLLPGTTNADIARRFRAEAKAASASGHPNIVEVYDAGETSDGRPFIVMEYLEGKNLYQKIERDGAFDVEAVRTIGVAVARALEASHSVGVVHRDLKAENVVLAKRSDGTTVTKVVDFGIAHGIPDGEGRSTRAGLAMGTPEYMAPEQARGAPAAPPIDIYALGVLLYEMLTGAPPFENADPLAIITAKLNDPVPPILEKRPEIPKRMASLVMQCLAREPQNRPASAGEVAERLESLGDHATTARGLDVASVVPTEGREKRAGLLWLVAPFALLAVAFAFALWPKSEAAPELLELGLDVDVSRDVTGMQTKLAFLSIPDAVRQPPDAGPTPAAGPLTKPQRAAETSLPAVAIDPPPNPTPKPAAKPTPKQDRATSEDCIATRQRAEDAHIAHFWGGVLRETRLRHCWKNQAERKTYEALALKNLNRFEECLRVADGSSDVELQKTADFCRARLKKSP